MSAVTLSDASGSVDPGTLRKVVFRLPAIRVPDGRHVALVGSFNQWSAHVHPLRKDPQGDCWTITVMLPPGTYTYLYDVDGGWYNDPDDDGRMPTGWGNEYSLKVVR